MSSKPTGEWIHPVRLVPVGALVADLVIAPLLSNLLTRAVDGRFVTAPVLWRSSMAGAEPHDVLHAESEQPLPMRVEHEYTRGGALGLSGRPRCASGQGLRSVRGDDRHRPVRPTGRPGDDASPVRDGASRVLDRGQRLLTSRRRLHRAATNSLSKSVTLVHGPVHASWLNQIEIYFSIVQRKVLTPNDFESLAEVEDRLLAFQQYYEAIATPFQWRFTRDDLDGLLHRLDAPAALRPAA